MGDQQIVLLAAAIFWASVDAQVFTVKPLGGYKPGNMDVELVWEFDVGTGGTFLVGEWWNTEGVTVMSKIGSDNTTVISGFEHKFAPIGEYGMKILNFTDLDNGIYTCRARYRQTNVTFLDDFVNISASTIEGDALNTPKVIVAIENEQFVLRENFTTLAVAVLTELNAYAPVNNPPLVDAVISVSDVSEQETKKCFGLSDENCTMEFVPEKEGNITITVTLNHPLVDTANVTWIMTIENKGPDDPGAECKWWCILLIVLPMVIVVIVIICCCWHYKVACFRHKSSAQIDVNQKQETNGYGMENKAY